MKRSAFASICSAVALIALSGGGSRILLGGEIVITGSVWDQDNGQPIPVATVRISSAGARQMTPVVTKSDFSGHYRASLDEQGPYVVSAEGDGLIAPSFIDRAPAIIRVVSGISEYKADLYLIRPGALTGRLMDKISGAPVAGIAVRAMCAKYFKGRLSAYPVAGPVRSGADGRFRFENLPSGDYYVEVSPSRPESITPATQPDYTDKKPRPKGLPRRFEPDMFTGSSLLRLFPGSEVNVGEIELGTEPLYRVRGSFAPGQCIPGKPVYISLSQRYGQGTISRANTTIACGSGFTIENLSPRRKYLLNVGLKGETGVARRFAEREIGFEEEDLEYSVSLSSPAKVSGMIQLPRNAQASLIEGLRVSLRPVSVLAFADERPVKPETDGTFTLSVPHSGEVELIVSGLDAPFCLGAVEYNGAPVHPVFRLEPAATEHVLRLAVSDKAGSFSGTVNSGDRPVPNAIVAIAPWPMQMRDEHPVAFTTRADAKGKFEKSGLTPGVYRVIAVAETVERRLDLPNVLAQLLQSKADTELTGGGSKTLSLEITVL